MFQTIRLPAVPAGLRPPTRRAAQLAGFAAAAVAIAYPVQIGGVIIRTVLSGALPAMGSLLVNPLAASTLRSSGSRSA